MSEEFRRTEHSDILVHWTGCDIDRDDPRMQKSKEVGWRQFPLRPIERPSLIDVEQYEIAGRYLQRVRDTLKFGLWLVEDKPLQDLGKSPSTKPSSKDDGRFRDAPVARTFTRPPEGHQCGVSMAL